MGREDDEYRLMQDALEQVELADKLGIEYVWEVEHHFLEEYSHSSAPEVFLAAASQRTKNIRLGHGIIQTSPLYNHPARTAERVATLDLVSGGRVEFGSGESATTGEMGGFNVDPFLKREQWREGLEVAVRCLTETPFGGVDGKWVKMPPRNVVPKPFQRPHPPLWVACSRRDTIMMAAELGLGVAHLRVHRSRGGARLDRGAREAAREVHADRRAREHRRRLRDADDGAQGRARGDPPRARGRQLLRLLARVLRGVRQPRSGHDRPVEGLPEQAPRARLQLRARDQPSARSSAPRSRRARRSALRGAVGTPDQLRGYLRRFEAAGVDQLIFVLQAGKNRHEHIMESIELFGREILPEFKDRDQKQRDEKAARLAPVVDAALARKQRNAPRMPADYNVPAVMKQLFKDAGGDALLEKIAEESAVGGGALSEPRAARGAAVGVSRVSARGVARSSRR